jgi:hypothetical protein
MPVFSTIIPTESFSGEVSPPEKLRAIYFFNGLALRFTSSPTHGAWNRCSEWA